MALYQPMLPTIGDGGADLLQMYRRHRRYLTSLILGDEERRPPSAHPGFNRPTFAFGDGIPSVNSMGGTVNVKLYLTIAASIRAAMA